MQQWPLLNFKIQVPWVKLRQLSYCSLSPSCQRCVFWFHKSSCFTWHSDFSDRVRLRLDSPNPAGRGAGCVVMIVNIIIGVIAITTIILNAMINMAIYVRRFITMNCWSVEREEPSSTSSTPSHPPSQVCWWWSYPWWWWTQWWGGRRYWQCWWWRWWGRSSTPAKSTSFAGGPGCHHAHDDHDDHGDDDEIRIRMSLSVSTMTIIPSHPGRICETPEVAILAAKCST